MSATLLIPDDLHQQLRERAARNHSSVDEFAIFLMRSAIGPDVRDYPILKEGRFACFELPKDSLPLEVDKIMAAMHDD